MGEVLLLQRKIIVFKILCKKTTSIIDIRTNNWRNNAKTFFDFFVFRKSCIYVLIDLVIHISCKYCNFFIYVIKKQFMYAINEYFT